VTEIVHSTVPESDSSSIGVPPSHSMTCLRVLGSIFAGKSLAACVIRAIWLAIVEQDAEAQGEGETCTRIGNRSRKRT